MYCCEFTSFTSGSIDNFTRHLKRKHPAISTTPKERHRNEESLQTAAGAEPGSTGIAVVQSRLDRFIQKPLSNNKKRKIDERLITMIATEYHPLNIVNNAEFKKFVELLNPSYNLPTRETLSESFTSTIF